MQYGGSEQELVKRVVMNFHPNILAHAAFIDRPSTLREMYQAIGSVEEKLSMVQERQRLQLPSAGVHNTRGAPILAPRGLFLL
jgi:hypothetical protein